MLDARRVLLAVVMLLVVVAVSAASGAAASFYVLRLTGVWTSKAPDSVERAGVTEAQPVERRPRGERPPAEPVDEEPVEPAPVEEEPAEPAEDLPETTYIISAGEHSELTWVGYGGVLGQMPGGFSVFDGTVVVPGEDIEQAEIDVTVQMGSLYSTSRLLTRTLLGDEFFQVREYPEAVFQSTGIEQTDEEDVYRVSGNLQMMDHTLNLTFPATIRIEEDGLHASADFVFDRHAWGITYHGTGENFIEDELRMGFDLVALPED